MATDHHTTPHAWLDAGAVRTASDIALACVLLGAAAAALLGAATGLGDRFGRTGPGFFPAVVGGSLAAVGLILLVRGLLIRLAPPERWRLATLAVVVVAIPTAVLAAVQWGRPLALYFGPSEFTALIVFLLAVGIGLVRVSRVRALGMVLLGLLLAMVGTDVSTGTSRFTAGFGQLADGITYPVVWLGLLVLGDGLLCLASPSLLLAIYARRIAGWTGPRVPILAAIAIRLAAGLAIIAAGYYAFELNRAMFDVGVFVALGLFGALCKLLGWNRLVLVQAFAYGPLLEENIRRSLLISRGDPAIFVRWPISGTLMLLAAAIVALVAASSVWRVFARRRKGG